MVSSGAEAFVSSLQCGNVSLLSTHRTWLPAVWYGGHFVCMVWRPLRLYGMEATSSVWYGGHFVCIVWRPLRLYGMEATSSVWYGGHFVCMVWRPLRLYGMEATSSVWYGGHFVCLVWRPLCDIFCTLAFYIFFVPLPFIYFLFL